MLNRQLHLDHNHNNLDNKLEQTSLGILIYWIDLQGDNHRDYLFEALFRMILLDILSQPFRKIIFDEFYFRWLENSVVGVGNATPITLMFNPLY